MYDIMKKAIDCLITQEATDVADLFQFCPNHMLWECIRRNDAVLLSWKEALHFLERDEPIYVFREPLPNLSANKPLQGALVPGHTLREALASENGEALPFSVQRNGENPLYIFDEAFHWMLVLTEENTSDGEELCVLLRAQDMR